MQEDDNRLYCVRFLDCKEAKLEYLQELIDPVRCGLDKNGEIQVCCSNSTKERAQGPGDFAINGEIFLIACLTDL